MPELIAIVKHDCPVCDQVLPALDAAGARLVLAVEPTTETAGRRSGWHCRAVPELDAELGGLGAL